MEGIFVKEKSFYKNIFFLTFPLVFQQLLRLSVDTLNSMMLGNIDQLQMSAVSQANQVFFIFYTVCSGFGVGCCALVAQYWGKQDIDAIKTVLAAALRYTAVLGLIVTAIVMLAPESVMRIYSSDPELIALGAGYLRIVAIMYTPCALSVMLFAGCRGIEQVGIFFKTNVISYPLNIILNYCFLFGAFGFPRLGITGIAIATIIARLTELLILSVYVLFIDKRMSFKLRDLLRRDKTLSKDLAVVAAPIVAHEIIWSFGTSAGSMITGQLGTGVVAGFNVTTVLYDLCGSLGNGFLNACSVVIGKTIGMGKVDKVKKQAQTILVMGLILGLAIGLFTFLIRGAFLSLYDLTPEASGYAMQFMAVYAVIWPFSLLEMVGMIAILRAGGDGKTGFYTDIVSMWLTTIPLAAAGAFIFGWPPVVVVTVIKLTIVIEAIVGIIRVLSMRWVHDLTRHKTA